MYSILLAEDERWVRVALRKTVEKTGLPFKVVYEATNGMEAYDWLKRHTADLIMTDIRMPIMDGIALLEEIRSLGGRHDLIVISGHDDFGYAQKALRLGAFDYMLKPVETETMKECLGRWLTAKKRERPDQESPGLSSPDRSEELSPIGMITRRIESAPEANMTLSEAAALVHLNPSYFSKLFKQQTGINFTDYITTVKMNEGSRLLKKTSLRVSEIADRLGYADLAYFSNTFKKAFGVTPSEYRKQTPASAGKGG